MLISAKVHYASLALLELAARYRAATPVAPLAASEIAARHGIPGPFLNQILRDMRSAGWVRSVRGSNGGYLLIVDPATITLLDIFEHVGCHESQDRCEGNTTAAGSALQTFWDDADDAARDVLASKTLEDVLRACLGNEAVMFYI